MNAAIAWFGRNPVHTVIKKGRVTITRAMTGIMMFFKACLNRIVLVPAPYAFAVLM